MKRSAGLMLIVGMAGLTALGLVCSTSSGVPASPGPSSGRPTSPDPTAQAPQSDSLARTIKLEEGQCAPLPDYCNCGNFRRQGKKCLFEVRYEADGTEIPKSRLYVATLDCGECRNIDPPAPNEKAGVVILRGPHCPDVARELAQPYDDLIYWVKKYRRDFEGKTDVQLADAANAEQLIAKYKRRIAEVLIDRCLGYFYYALPAGQRIPLEAFTYSMHPASEDGAPMETHVQFAGAQLIVHTDCFYDQNSLAPTPELFCAALLHEIYHWQQEGYGGGSSELEHIIYELACTEKMVLNSFYLWILGPDRAIKEFHAPQSDYWLTRFKKEWAKLDKAGRKKVAGWAWSRGGVKDTTPEDSYMRDLMYFRHGWLYDFWETLFAATELKIIRMPLSPLDGLFKKTP